MRRTLLIAAGGVVVILLALQLVPVPGNGNNPPVLAEPAWDSPETRALAQRACFDCHSNETSWPVYSRIAPISWLVTRDVVEGRDHLNFSEWGLPGRGDHAEEGEAGEAAEDVAEVIRNGEMPLPIYLPLHPEARLSAAEQQALIAGLQRSLR